MCNSESCAGVRRHALSQVRTLAHLGSHVAVEHAGKRHGRAVGAASQAHRRDNGVPVLHARPPTCHTGRGWERVQTKPQSKVLGTSPWASSPALQEVRHRQSSVCRHRNSPWSSATPKWTVRGACPAGAPPGALPPPRASNICAHHSRPVRPAFKSWRTCVLQTPSTNTCPPVRLQEAHGLRDEMLAPQTVPAK